MMKGVAVKLPDEILEEVDRLAASEFDGNRNRAVEAVLKKGLAYDDLEAERDRLEAWVTDWEQAGFLARSKWVVFGRRYETD